jgi:hypothetical protein
MENIGKQGWAVYKNNNRDALPDAYRDLKMVLYQYYGGVNCGPHCKELENVRSDVQSKNENFSIKELPLTLGERKYNLENSLVYQLTINNKIHSRRLSKLEYLMLSRIHYVLAYHNCIFCLE